MSAIVLVSKPGITNASTLSIPKDWDSTWFKNLVSNLLKGADVRNAIAGPGITITGNIASPYATISAGGPGNPTFTGNVTITPTSGVGLTVNAASGQRAAIFQGAPGVFAVEIDGSSTSGQSDGLYIKAGTTAADVAIRIDNFAASATYLEIFGDNHGNLGPNLTWTAGGLWTWAAPTTANSQVLVVHSIATAGQSYGIIIEAGTNSSDFNTEITDHAGATNYVLFRGDGAVFFPAIGTTATAANATLVAGSFANQILKFSSSIRYKTNVQTIDQTAIEAILQLRPVQYTSLCAADDPTVLHLGFIAEEVAAIDPRLVEYTPAQWLTVQSQRGSRVATDVVPDPKAPLIPDGVQYAKLTALLVGAVQALAARLTQLENNAQTKAVIPPAAPLTLTGAYGVNPEAPIFTGTPVPITTVPLAASTIT